MRAARRQQLMRRPHKLVSSSSSSTNHHLPQPATNVSLDYNCNTNTSSNQQQPNSTSHQAGGSNKQQYVNVLTTATSTSSSSTHQKLPGGPGDLTLAELQEMATRQQQQMEAQQQVLVAKEQRLKYLKQQEARHAQLASESERLRKIRERVESQELKLKKLRALRGQAEQYRNNNGQLNSELDAVKAVFNEKEKELAMAVARVDQLNRQLTDLRNGKINNTGLSGQKHAAAALELEKLRKELLLRNKLNEQQTNNITAKEKVLQQKREEMKNMDNRILELQQRLKKRKLQEDQNRPGGYDKQQVVNNNNNKQSNKENTIINNNNSPGVTAVANAIKSGDPYIQYAPSDVVKDDSYSQQGRFVKQDPKYQTLPAGVQLTHRHSNVDAAAKAGSRPPHHNQQQNQYDGRDQGDYNLPVVLPLGHGNNNTTNQNRLPGFNRNGTTNTSQQQQQQRPPPPTHPPPPSTSIKPHHHQHHHTTTFNNNDSSKPNQNYNTNLPSSNTTTHPHPHPAHSQHPVPTQRQQQTHQRHHNTVEQQQQPPSQPQTTTTHHHTNRPSYPAGPKAPKGSSSGPEKGVGGVSSMASSHPLPSLHPVIAIHEEERQAGSGQSSPASSEGSSNSSGGIQIKQDQSNVINESPIGSVSAMIQRLNSNKDGGVKASDPSHQQPQPNNAQGQNGSLTTKEAFEGVSTFFPSNKPNNNNAAAGLQHDEYGESQRKGSDSNSKTPSTPSAHPPHHPHLPPTSSSSSSSSQPSSHPQLNVKPAPTYRYASKNQIANTYMGRLGGAAMERYQQNLQKLYKNMESPDSATASKSGPPGAADADLDPSSPSQQTSGVAVLAGQEGEGQQTFGVVSPHDYPDIASDKGSYKLNTPKQVRRRHSDGESDDVNKALQDRQEQEGKGQQLVDSGGTIMGHKDKSTTVSDKSAAESENEKTISSIITPKSPSESLPSPTTPTSSSPSSPSPATSTTTVTSSSSTSSSSSTPVMTVSDTAAKQPLPSNATKDASSNNKSNKTAPTITTTTVVKKTKSNLKKTKGGPRRCNNRITFDPLALLLDGSLEGELDLVKKVAVQVDNVSSPNDEGITALHNAICAGHYDIVKFLIEFGCDVNSPDSDGWTPLHCAASCNNLPMVRFLVEHGACVFATTISDQETAADKCEEDEDGYDGCSDYLYSIQEKLGITNSGEVYAVFDYAASQTDECSFCINDKMAVIRKGDDTEKEWWWARHTSSSNGNKEGYIPRNLLGLFPRVLQQPSEVSEC